MSRVLIGLAFALALSTPAKAWDAENNGDFELLDECIEAAAEGLGVEKITDHFITAYYPEPPKMHVRVGFEAQDNLTLAWVWKGIEQGMWRLFEAIFTCPETVTQEAHLYAHTPNEVHIVRAMMTGATAREIDWEGRWVNPAEVWDWLWVHPQLE